MHDNPQLITIQYCIANTVQIVHIHKIQYPDIEEGTSLLNTSAWKRAGAVVSKDLIVDNDTGLRPDWACCCAAVYKTEKKTKKTGKALMQ